MGSMYMYTVLCADTPQHSKEQRTARAPSRGSSAWWRHRGTPSHLLGSGVELFTCTNSDLLRSPLLPVTASHVVIHVCMYTHYSALPLLPLSRTNKKIPRGPPSPPAPVLHSPTRKVTAKEQQDWKIPPCISSWKNPRVGWTLALLSEVMCCTVRM